MQQSKDIVILDNDKTDAIPIVSTNDTAIKFDDILTESEQLDTKINKVPKVKFQQPKFKKNQNATNWQSNGDISAVEEKQNMIHIIQKYQSSEIFGQYVRNELKVSYNEDTLNKKSNNQLNAILTKIRVKLDNKNLNKMYDSVLFGSTAMIETISKPIANVDGFNKMLMENQEFLNCWERFKCESVMPTIPSHIQMVFILGQTYFLAYAMNKMKEPSQETLEIIDDIKQEIKDDEQKLQKQVSDTKKENDTIEKPPIKNGMNI